MEPEKLKSIIESILFISGEPVKISKIAIIAGISKPEAENAIMMLESEYSNGKRGMIVLKKEDEIQMSTNPENSEIISQLVKSEMQENLSKAALEVLSIVAYRSPISRFEIEAIRGVNCTFTLRSLLMRGLIERIENPKDNRSFLYKISFEFLKKIGVENVKQLPDFETLSQDKRVDSIIR